MKIRADIAELLRAGLSDRAVARQVGVNTRRVAPVRAALGLPRHRPGRNPSPSLAEGFRARTRRTGDGHLEWTGAVNDGHPRIKYDGHFYSAYRLAFRLRTGRDPRGYARPVCGRGLCVEPAHVEDTPGRRALDDTYTAIFGTTA